MPREAGSGWVKGFLKKTEQGVDALPPALHSFSRHCGRCLVYTVKWPCILYCPPPCHPSCSRSEASQGPQILPNSCLEGLQSIQVKLPGLYKGLQISKNNNIS